MHQAPYVEVYHTWKWSVPRFRYVRGATLIWKCNNSQLLKCWPTAWQCTCPFSFTPSNFPVNFPSSWYVAHKKKSILCTLSASSLASSLMVVFSVRDTCTPGMKSSEVSNIISQLLNLWLLFWLYFWLPRRANFTERWILKRSTLH